MKRSKMVEILADEICGEYSWDGPRTKIGLEYAFQIAENVLKKAEEKGMIPPGYSRPHDWNERGITYSQWLQEPSKINEWEPENG